MKPFFSYFGAKARIAKKYPEPKHNTIIELIDVDVIENIDRKTHV